MRARWWLAAALLGVLASSRCGESVRVATFNIRMFPESRTDRARVAEVLAELDADVVAVQEIRDVTALQAALARASELGGRDLRVVLSQCGGGGHPTTGLVWDAARLRLSQHRDYPGLQPDGDGVCGPSQPGLLGVFETEGGERFAALSIHFSPFPNNYDRRKKQWQAAMQIVGAVKQELGVEVLMLGDANSTGLTSAPDDERRFIDDTVRGEGYTLLTEDVACTEYWRSQGRGTFAPSRLDHIVASGGAWSPATVEQMCRRLQCRPTAADAMDPDFERVSDHCPVVVEGDL